MFYLYCELEVAILYSETTTERKSYRVNCESLRAHSECRVLVIAIMVRTVRSAVAKAVAARLESSKGRRGRMRQKRRGVTDASWTTVPCERERRAGRLKMRHTKEEKDR